MNSPIIGKQIKVKGIIQGVGFRPFIYTTALENDLTGWVRNSSSGVEIIVNGSETNIDRFLDQVKNNPPLLARIDSLQVIEIPVDSFTSFTIIPSQVEEGQFVPISPDMSICPDCEKELFDPSNFRFRYPFINCTNCGPRFSIIKDIPYDRPKTTMASFQMCPTCNQEYKDPLNRRFHAQPIACSKCGPQVWFESNGAFVSQKENAIQDARKWLCEGKIIAIKGLGGYHLACDACNAEAVTTLRARKKRSDKPFALMAFSLQNIQEFCEITAAEIDLLKSPQHPIVLLKAKNKSQIAYEVAPGQNHLGFMLPYTPLHLLLLEPGTGFPKALVMTSGNISEEPVAFEDQEAKTRLAAIADGYLLNDRPIHMRVDDSVYRIFHQQPYPIRRSRGYAPQSIHLPAPVKQTLACGAELKNTFCLTRDQYAFLSHHIGDLENFETLHSFETGIEHFKKLFRIEPELITADLHPDYLSTHYAVALSEENSLPLIQVQHHHAHLAACLADNEWESPDPVIGLTYDGTGYGPDGVIWGGEVLLGGYSGYERCFHFSEMPLPGGDAAIRHPSRIALAYLLASNIEWENLLPPVENLSLQERNVLHSQIERNINTPKTTSLGRLFDAVSALIGVRQDATYEGQAAIELENICDPDEKSFYKIEINEDEFSIQSLLQQIIEDIHQSVRPGEISARFHNGIAHCTLASCLLIREKRGINTVAFSGGVWQNMTLLEKNLTLLHQEGFQTLIHRQVPTNDGGISLGQVLIANNQKTN